MLANVVVQESYTLAAGGRGEAPDTRRIEDDRKLLALEAAGGTNVFMRSDRMSEELARLYPEAVKDGQIDLSRFRDSEAASRGVGDWIWQRVSALRLDRDAIIDQPSTRPRDALREVADKLDPQSAAGAGSVPPGVRGERRSAESAPGSKGTRPAGDAKPRPLVDRTEKIAAQAELISSAD